MAQRRKMNRGQSRGNFHRGNHINSRNYAMAMRGGYRI